MKDITRTTHNLTDSSVTVGSTEHAPSEDLPGGLTVHELRLQSGALWVLAARYAGSNPFTARDVFVTSTAESCLRLQDGTLAIEFRDQHGARTSVYLPAGTEEQIANAIDI